MAAQWLPVAWWVWVFWLGGLAVGAESPGKSPPAPVEEYKLKAIFLYKFTTFVEWPAAAFETTNAPFVVGVLGRDPFGPHLQQVAATKSVYGRRMVLQHFDAADKVRDARCHLLFIPKSERENLSRLLTWLKTAPGPKPPILTVSEAADFPRDGLIINLLVEEKTRHLQFQIDRDAAAAAGLKVSSELLDLAKTVYGSATPANP